MRDDLTKQINQSITQVWRKLFLQRLVNTTMYCWAVALWIVALWFFIHPLQFGELGLGWFRWTLLGLGFLTGTAAALVISWVQAPARVTAALALDSKFDLKERVTTSILLNKEDQRSPAGQAVLTDTSKQLAKLKVASRFPVKLPWQVALIPVVALLVMGLAIFLEPALARVIPVTPANNKTTLTEKQAKKIKDQLAQLRKQLREGKKQEDLKEAPKDVREIQQKWEKLLKDELDATDKNEVRDRVKKMQQLEEEIEKKIDEAQQIARRNENRRKRLEQMNKVLGGEGKDEDQEGKGEDGPAKDLFDAIQKGNDNKVEQEVEELKDKLDKGELRKEERNKLQQQLANKQKQIENLGDPQARREQLEREKQLGNLDQKELDQLEKEVEQLEKFGELKKDIENLNQLIGEDPAKQQNDKNNEKGKNDGKKQNPMNGQQNPMNGQQNPMNGQQKPMNGQQNPMNGQQKPMNGQQNPMNGQQNPMNGQQNPMNGQQNNGKKAGELLKKIAGQLQQTKKNANQLQQQINQGQQQANGLKQLQQQLQGAKQGRGQMARVLGNQPNQQGGQRGQGKQAGGPPGGMREFAKESKTGSKDERQEGFFDKKGARAIGFYQGGRHSKIDAKEVPATFRAAAQRAQQAIDRQRITPEAAEMVKKYYENLSK